MSQSVFPTSNSGVFIPSLWETPTGEFTREYADLHYLRFPIGQGSQTIPANLNVSGTASLGTTTATSLNVSGTAKIQSSLLTSDTSNTSYTQKLTAYSGAGNAFYGYGSGYNITTGNYNSGFGQTFNLFNLTTGSNNCGFGYGAGQNLSTGSNNTFIGMNSTSSTSVASNATIVGYASQCSSGDSPTAIGANSTANGANSTAIGANATTASFTNSTAIGKSATATASNQIMLGTSTETVIIPRNIRYLSPPMIAYSFTSTTQTINSTADVVINFPTADARNSIYTGITYSAGTFTNSNSYSVTISVSVCISIQHNPSNTRVVFIAHSAQGRLAMTDINANTFASEPTVLTTSGVFVLNSGESFYSAVFQNSGVSLIIGGNPATYANRISFLVM